MKSLPAAYPAALLIAFVAVLPLLVLFDMASGAEAVGDGYNLRILLNSLLLTLLTVVGSIVIGVPLAILTSYVQLPFQRIWLIVLASPLALPSYIGAFTLYAASGPSGEFSQLFGIPLPVLEGLTGATLTMVIYSYPYVMLTTRASLLSLDGSQVNAARTLGLSLGASLLRIVLPRAFTGIASGSLLVALYTLSDFGTPAFMRFDTFTRIIFVEYNAFGLAEAAMFSLQLMAVVAVILIIESQVKGGKERPGRHLEIWPNRWVLACSALAIVPILILAILVPLSVLGIWLIREGTDSFDFTYAWNSAYTSMLAALVCVIVALPIAYAAIAGTFGKLMERITFVGFGLPGIVMGTAMVYVGLQLPFLYQTLALLIFAYVVRFLPLAVGSIRSTAEGLDPGLSKAARVLGASPNEAYRRITLPLTLKGMIAGAALVFLEAMRELPATLMLGPSGFENLATYLWRVYEAGYFGRAAVPGLLLILISSIGLAIMLSGESKASLSANREQHR